MSTRPGGLVAAAIGITIALPATVQDEQADAAAEQAKKPANPRHPPVPAEHS